MKCASIRIDGQDLNTCTVYVYVVLRRENVLERCRKVSEAVLTVVNMCLCVLRYALGVSALCVDGRPRGSSSEKDYEVGREGKRPFGTSAEREFGVGKEGGRPEGTMAERGFGVGREGGRSEGTTTERGVGVGREGGRPEGTSERAGFKVGGQARPSVCQHIM